MDFGMNMQEVDSTTDTYILLTTQDKYKTIESRMQKSQGKLQTQRFLLVWVELTLWAFYDRPRARDGLPILKYFPGSTWRALAMGEKQDGKWGRKESLVPVWTAQRSSCSSHFACVDDRQARGCWDAVAKVWKSLEAILRGIWKTVNTEAEEGATLGTLSSNSQRALCRSETGFPLSAWLQGTALNPRGETPKRKHLDSL